MYQGQAGLPTAFANDQSVSEQLTWSSDIPGGSREGWCEVVLLSFLLF